MNILKEIILVGGDFAVLLFELLALIVVIFTGMKGVIFLLKKEGSVALYLLKGFSTGLSFLLGAEILKTVALEDTSELLMVAGIVMMRVALSILIHWEMKQENQHELSHHDHSTN